MLGFHAHSIGRFLHGQRRVTGKQLHQHARVGGIEMLHEDEGHAARRRHGAQETSKRIEPAGRRADRNDRKVPNRIMRVRRQ